MRIENVEFHTVRVSPLVDWTFVQVLTDDGLSGLGELNPSVRRGGRLPLARKMADSLVGRDPRRIRQIVDGFRPAELDAAGVRVLSGLEQALWDLLGKSLQAPVHALLGGACRREVRVYANINRATRPDRSPEAFARNAAAAVRDGHDAVKLAPFDGLPPAVDGVGPAGAGIDCLRAVRDTIGPGVDLLVDCHSRFTAKGALETAEALGGLDLFWFEEPLPQDDYDGYERVKAGCGMPVAGGESRALCRGWWEVLHRRALDVAMPDVTIVGGLSELHQVAAMAASRGIPTAPHGPFGPVAAAAAVQAMAAHPEFLILEYAWGEAPWRAQLIQPPERIAGGRLAVSGAPGLGVELDMRVVDEHRLPD